MLMRALYSLNIFLYGIVIRLASPFNSKARSWIKGRRQLFDQLKQKIASGNGPVVWFHCASLGEFEQGRPLMENFKTQFPGHRILLTFFSPSGYDVRKNYPGADIVTYLPLDTPANARRFIGIVKPSLVFFVKYEFWLNHLSQLSKKKIPHYLVSAIFREQQVFFRAWGSIFREALQEFTFIFTQEKRSAELLGKIGITNAAIAGDTRFDRVAEIAAHAKAIPVAAAFSNGCEKIIVAGSTWPSDEEVLFPAIAELLRSDWKMIIAPHELGEDHLAEIEKRLSENGIASNEILRFSKADEASAALSKILLIDNIGMLSSLYRYGKIAYIGGGFGKSIHNTIEAAVYGIPVVFGPRFEKFNEANELISCGGGFGVASGNELKNTFHRLCNDAHALNEAGKKAGEYVAANTGATQKILGKATEGLSR